MPPRPVRRHRNVVRYPAPSSVIKISNLAQWNRMHKRGKNQLIFVMYTMEDARGAHRLVTTLKELSEHSEFKDVIFAIVDIEKASEVAEQEGVTEAPTFVCYQFNHVIDRLERVTGDSAPSSLWQMLHRNAVKVRAENSRNMPDIQQPAWRAALGKIVGFVAISISSLVLAVVLIQPVHEAGSYRPKKTRVAAKSTKDGSDESSDDE